MTIRAALGLDLDAVRVVRADFVQRDQVRHDEAEQHERHGDHVKGEEAVQRRVADDVVAADQQGQVRADERHGGEQVHDHLRAPVAHLAPGQQVAHEGLGHQREEDHAAEEPDQLTRLPVAAVHQAAEHVQIDDDEEGRRTRRVHVADQPAPGHVAHDVLDRAEGERRVGLVVHRQEDAGDDLHHQHQHRERAEDVPPVEVLRRVVLAPLIVPQLGQRKAVVDPGQSLFQRWGVGARLFEFSHVVLSSKGCCRVLGPRLPCRHQTARPVATAGRHALALSRPMIRRVSDRNAYGGTSRLSGAGLFLNTRPAMSKVEPWHGHRKPPSQSFGSEGCGPV